MRHPSERSHQSTPSAPKKLPIKASAITAITAGIVSTIGAQEAQAEPLQFNNYAACLGTGPTNLRGMTMSATLDSDDPLGTVTIKGNQFLDSWNYDSSVDKSLISEHLVFDGKNYYGTFFLPSGDYKADKTTGEKTEHQRGFYFFQIPTAVVGDYVTKESAFANMSDAKYYTEFDITITKLPNGDTAYENIQAPFIDGNYFIKRFKPTFDTANVMNGLTEAGTQQIQDLLPESIKGNLNARIFGEYLVITEFVPDPDPAIIHICKKDPITGQYTKPISAKFMQGGSPSTDLTLESSNQWTLNQAFYKDCNGEKSIIFTVFTGGSLKINLDNPDDQKFIPDISLSYIIDDEGRYRVGDIYKNGAVEGMLWTDLKTKKTATTPKGINGKIISYMGKWKNDQGEWVRLWATYNQIWMLIGDDITKIQYKEVDALLPTGIDIDTMACIGMQQHHPVLTPKPVEQGPEQQPEQANEPDTNDSGETTGTGDGSTVEQTTNPEPNTVDAGTGDNGKPADTEKDTNTDDINKPDADTEKETEPTTEPTPEQEDTAGTTEPSITEQEPDAGAPNTDADTTDTPLINDTNQSIDTIQQQPAGNSGGCNVGERISPNSPLGLAILTAAMGAITMNRRTKATSRDAIRREIEEVLER